MKKYSIILLVMILVFPFSLFACQRTGPNGLLLDVRYYDEGASAENIKEGNARYIVFFSNNTGTFRHYDNYSENRFTVNFVYEQLDDESVMITFRMSSKVYDEERDVSSATAVVHAIFMVSRHHVVHVSSQNQAFPYYFATEQYLAQNGFLD